MIKYPDYNNGLVNLACSVLKNYGAQYQHASLLCMDELLEKNYKNSVVMLFDGMGVDALEHHLPEDSFLRRHYLMGISSVFPPTTTSATTSLECGLTPAEHGWLGWSLYFSEVDKIVNAFINTVKDSNDVAEDYHVAQKYLPYKSIYDKINETGNAKAYSVSPFGTNHISSFTDLFQEVKRLCNQDGKKYIYSYWDEPDGTMHFNGCYNEAVKDWIIDIDRSVEAMCKELTDTLVIVTADHGHCNLKHRFVSDHPEIMKMLKRPIAIETRATCFYVKEEYLMVFAKEFHKAFGNDFLLLSKQEVIEQKLFGDGDMHPKFEEFIGDFLAISISDVGIVQSHESNQFISNHAGMTEQEMLVPFIAVEVN